MSDYQQAFFTVPYRIFQLEGITISFLRFYETIFQFWHHDKPCFLRNDAIMMRTGIASISTIQEAFQFFEKNNELKRVHKDGKRYIIQPKRHIEIENDCAKGIDKSIEGYRQSDREGIAKSIHNNNNTNNTNINKSSYASGDAQSRFDDFWNAYPKKRDKARCHKLWQKKNLDNIADKLLEDIQQRVAQDAQWQDAQYIPYPSTYLNGQRWEDEIINPTAKRPSAFDGVCYEGMPTRDVKSNVKFWAPGNPDYDRAHGIE